MNSQQVVRTLLRYSGIAVFTGVVLIRCSAQQTISDRTPTARSGTTYTKLPDGTKVATTTSGNGVKATLDPNATSAQLISLDSGALSGVSIAFPVGSLSIPLTISVMQGQSVSGDTLLQNLGISGNGITNSGTPVEVTASAAKDLTSPMVLAIPIPNTTGLVDSTVDRTKLAVIYRVKVAEGDKAGGNFTGIVPASTLAIDNGKVLFETKYFGWFSVVVMQNTAPAATEVKATYADQRAAMMFATTADLPSCTTADTNRIAYVAAPSDGKYWVYCNGSSWIAVPKNPVDVVVPTPYPTPSTAQPARLLRQSDNTEIGRVLAVGTTSSPTRLQITGSSGGKYIVDVYLNASTGISSSDIYSGAGMVYFTGTGCTGTAYTSSQPSGIGNMLLYVYLNSAYTWYSVSSTATSNVSYASYIMGSCSNSGSTLTTGYQLSTLSETLPIPNASMPWYIQ